ncbi:hypothetical protein AB4Y30_01430 [Ornithinibacillus sp. 4-3]|uniref:Uncharacterized protein n=1 Tax=Ornithinibacillus sp. 4-3 TaxID=3231488 RepID=A0AB39HPF4_9BACI
MVIALQVILLIIIFISFIGSFTEKEPGLRRDIMLVFIASILAYIVSAVWL